MIVVEGGFDDVFQLPDVAGPVIGQKDILYLAAVCHDLLVEFLVVVLAEIFHQQGDIPLPPVQLRDIVPQHAQAVEDILPDLIPLYAALRVLVDGGDDPHVHLLFLLGADAAGKLTGDVAFQVKDAVVQEFLRNLDHRPQLVRPDGYLAEGIIALGVSAFLINPGGSSLGRHHGDLAVSAGSLDHPGKLAEYILLFQCFHQGALIFVRHQIAALGIRTNLQRIHHRGHRSLGTHHVPEVLAVLIGGAPGLCILLAAHGFTRQGLVHRAVQFCLQRLLTFQAGDLLAQVGDLLLHAGIGGVILGGQDALIVSVGIQKGFRSFPGFGALLAQFKNRHSGILLNVSKD